MTLQIRLRYSTTYVPALAVRPTLCTKKEGSEEGEKSKSKREKERVSVREVREARRSRERSRKKERT